MNNSVLYDHENNNELRYIGNDLSDKSEFNRGLILEIIQHFSELLEK